MSAEFDPYYTWLGIPPQEQPPHYYRLLGIQALEDNRDAIAHAMDQRMAYLRTLQAGKHSEHCQKLLNEVSAAAVVLLDPGKKKFYDAALRHRLAAAASPQPVVPPPIADDVPPPPVAKPAVRFPVTHPAQLASLAAVVILLVVAVTIAGRMWGGAGEVADSRRRLDASAPGQPADGTPSPQPIEIEPPQPQDETPAARSAAADSIRQAARPSPGESSQPRAEIRSTDPPNPEVIVHEPSSPIPASPSPRPPSSEASVTVPSASADPAIEQPAVPLPTAEEIEAARTKVAEIFGAEARQALKPEQKVALAARMGQAAAETTKDPPVRYALLDAVRQLYAAAGEVDAALGAVASLADEFEEDVWELRLTTVTAMLDAPLPSTKRDQLATGLVTLVDRAVAEEEFAWADEMARLAVKAGSRSSDANVRRLVVQKRSDVTRLKELWQAVEVARDKLAVDDRDQASNLVVGKFLCFFVANFDEGIPHLAKSGRQPFAMAAMADQAAAQESPESAIRAGDAWYALAENIRTADKELVPGALLRMQHWYQLALPQLSGIEKARVEKRLQEIGSIASPPQYADESSAKAKGKRGKGKRKGKAKGKGAGLEEPATD